MTHHTEPYEYSVIRSSSSYLEDLPAILDDRQRIHELFSFLLYRTLYTVEPMSHLRVRWVFLSEPFETFYRLYIHYPEFSKRLQHEITLEPESHTMSIPDYHEKLYFLVRDLFKVVVYLDNYPTSYYVSIMDYLMTQETNIIIFHLFTWIRMSQERGDDLLPCLELTTTLSKDTPEPIRSQTAYQLYQLLRQTSDTDGFPSEYRKRWKQWFARLL